MQAYDQHLNMILGQVEETITTVEIDDETYEEIVKVSTFCEADNPYTRMDAQHTLDCELHTHADLQICADEQENCPLPLRARRWRYPHLPTPQKVKAS